MPEKKISIHDSARQLKASYAIFLLAACLGSSCFLRAQNGWETPGTNGQDWEPITKKDGRVQKNGQVTAKISDWVDSGYYAGASLIVGRVAASPSGKVEVIYEKYF